MYTPSHFLESRVPVLHEMIRAHPFAALVAHTRQGLDAEHLPLLLDASRGSHGVLQGHVARANPIWQVLNDGAEVLALFQGPQHYVSPNWYPSKLEHGKVVPTWNYVVVHARGSITWKHDRAWLHGLVEKTTNAHEGDGDGAWRVSDAPEDYVERMLGAIKGFEITIATLTGKWKLSQNRNENDRSGVIDGLASEPNDAAGEMLQRMREAEADGS